MKIAVTGHSAGIGKALTTILESRGHTIIGLSTRDGHNIRSVTKIANIVKQCDMFINNAQSGFAQTELLYEVWNEWQGQPNKYIWCISTVMTQYPINVEVVNQNDTVSSMYRTQKVTLENTVAQLRLKNDAPKITIIRPGAVATQPDQTPEFPYCDTDAWAELIFNTILMGNEAGMIFTDLSLSATETSMDL